MIARALTAGVTRMLAPGLDVASSRRCIALAVNYPEVYAAVGIHPTEAEAQTPDALDHVRGLSAQSRVVAIGEIGLDYYWVHDEGQQSRQRDLLERQLQLATVVHKPVILHAREHGDADHGPCTDDLLDILERWVEDTKRSDSPVQSPGVLHSFSGSLETARRAIELGFYIGVTGPVTYKNAVSRRDLIADLPLERLLIETDAPYLTPVPHRGQRNEPAYVAHIADKIAAIQSRPPREVAAVTAANADRLFSWGDIV